ncbi:hypothetical protein [Roseibacillus persicicus]|uniref:hypothetical protein n=1 Tax=Roseibacillus persicicus TaxID=454148 RepID=UPI00167A74A3|nr:hypothetical protein [Roseibacillus persicicus]
MSIPLIHIGHTKTGSTFLQRCCFSQKPFFNILDYGDISKLIIAPELRSFDHNAVKEAMSLPDESNQMIPIVSHECLLGNPVSGGFDEEVLAQRLKEIFPEAKILIVFREQYSHFASFYPEYLKHGGCESFVRFLNPPNHERMPYFSPSFFEYDLQVQRYQEIYGERNVLALPYEILKNDFDDFLKRLATFCGREIVINFSDERVNVNPSLTRLGLLRFLNRFRRTNLAPAPLLNVKGSQQLITLLKFFDLVEPKSLARWAFRKRARRAADDLDGYFSESNRRLSEIVGIELGELGYEVSEPKKR